MVLRGPVDRDQSLCVEWRPTNEKRYDDSHCKKILDKITDCHIQSELESYGGDFCPVQVVLCCLKYVYGIRVSYSNLW